MKPEQEDFEDVRRLLALKRYERPFPGYFSRFSQQVIERIEAGETGAEESGLGRLLKLSWLQNLWGSFETKPLLAGALGVSVCGLFMAGILYSEQIEPAQANFATVSEQPVMPQQSVGATANPLFGQVAVSGLGSTGVVVTAGDPAGGSLFQQIAHGQPQTQQVSFSVPSSN